MEWFETISSSNEFLLPIAKTNMILSLNHSERWGLPILNPNGCATTWIVLKVNTVVFNLLLTQRCLITNNKLSYPQHRQTRISPLLLKVSNHTKWGKRDKMDWGLKYKLDLTTFRPKFTTDWKSLTNSLYLGKRNVNSSQIHLKGSC